MRNSSLHVRTVVMAFVSVAVLAALNCAAGLYTNFDVAIYSPVGVVKSFAEPGKLPGDWECRKNPSTSRALKWLHLLQK